MPPPRLSLGGLHTPLRGSCSCSSLTPAHEVQCSPLTPHFLCASLRFYTVGIPSSSLTVSTKLSKPFANYLSVSVTWSSQGTLCLLTSVPCLHFAFGEGSATVTLVGRLKCLKVLPPPILLPLPSWSSSYCPVTTTPTSPLPASPAGTLLPPFPQSSFGRYIKTRLGYARPPGRH